MQLSCSFTAPTKAPLVYTNTILHRYYNMFRHHIRHPHGRLLSPFTRNSLHILQGQDPQGTGNKLYLLVQWKTATEKLTNFQCI